MKDCYVPANLEIIEFDSEDVITTSVGNETPGGEVITPER